MSSLPTNPTAEHVARAIVAAASLTGDDPVAVASGAPAVRARHYAAAALYKLFPQVLTRLIAQYVGMLNGSSQSSERSSIEFLRRKAAWWDESIVTAARTAVLETPGPTSAAAKPHSLIDAAAQRAPVQKARRLAEPEQPRGVVPMGEPEPGRSALDQKRVG